MGSAPLGETVQRVDFDKWENAFSIFFLFFLHTMSHFSGRAVHRPLSLSALPWLFSLLLQADPLRLSVRGQTCTNL